MFQAVNILSGDGGDDGGRCGPQIQECWEFEHPRRDLVPNEQGTSISFFNWSVVTYMLTVFTCLFRLTSN